MTRFDDEGDAVTKRAKSTDEIIRKEREEDAEKEAEASAPKVHM